MHALLCSYPPHPRPRAPPSVYLLLRLYRQFHDGLGFLTTHSLVSNTFEFSLQLVNPKLTLPYWDWTIEEVEAERNSEDGSLDIKSPLFTADWFGTADPTDWVVSVVVLLKNIHANSELSTITTSNL